MIENNGNNRINTAENTCVFRRPGAGHSGVSRPSPHMTGIVPLNAAKKHAAAGAHGRGGAGRGPEKGPPTRGSASVRTAIPGRKI